MGLNYLYMVILDYKHPSIQQIIEIIIIINMVLYGSMDVQYFISYLTVKLPIVGKLC